MKDALAASQAESRQASPDDASPGVPPVNAQASEAGEQAPKSEVEQLTAENDSPDNFDSELSSLLDDTVEDTQNGSESGVQPGSDEFWNLDVDIQTVNGQETVTVQELSEGYLRQADYTRKTQDLAAQREQAKQALDFFAAFQSDPEGFARSIGVQAGFLDEGATPIRDIPSAKIPSQEEIDARINEQLEERVSSDPRIQSAEIAAAQVQIDTEFSRLETEYGAKLSAKLREDILGEAFRLGSSDLEGILAKRLVQAQQKRSAAGGHVSTSRPGAAPQGSATLDADKSRVKPSMRQAWGEAKAAAAQQ
jgi:hypothetical protein